MLFLDVCRKRLNRRILSNSQKYDKSMVVVFHTYMQKKQNVYVLYLSNCAVGGCAIAKVITITIIILVSINKVTSPSSPTKIKNDI